MSVDDFGGLRKSDQVETKFSTLLEIYNKQKKKSLLTAIAKAFKGEYCLAFLICVVAAGLSYVSPFLVHMIIEFIQSERTDTMYGMKLVAALVSTQLVS